MMMFNSSGIVAAYFIIGITKPKKNVFDIYIQTRQMNQKKEKKNWNLKKNWTGCWKEREGERLEPNLFHTQYI